MDIGVDPKLGPGVEKIRIESARDLSRAVELVCVLWKPDKSNFAYPDLSRALLSSLRKDWSVLVL